MRRFPTGVTIVAVADHAGEPWGLTVSSFTSVSLDPPLVLVCIDRSSDTHDKLLDAEGFGVSVLSAAQAGVASRFAVDPSRGRFDDVAWRRGPDGHPVLEGASAWLECSIHEVLGGGDHSIILGRVKSSGVSAEPSMVYHEGAFGSVGS
jgi:flavin reductase (DIM6/NTAB) family NADH-FMN oxidoreductase RutF